MTGPRSSAELHEAAVRLLVRNLGYADAVRFITSLRPAKGDYTKDRRTLLRGWSATDVLASMRKHDSAATKPRKRRTA